MQLIILILALSIFLILRGIYSEKKKKKLLLEECKKAFENGDFSKLDRRYKPGNYIPDNIRCHQPFSIDIDEATWKDLHFDEIYQSINHCYSSTGADYLYSLLHHTSSSTEELINLENTIQAFTKHPNVAGDMMYHSTQLGYFGKLSIFDALDSLYSSEDIHIIYDILFDLLFIPLVILCFFRPLEAVIGIVLLILFNIYRYFSKKRILERHLKSISYIIRLAISIGDYIITLQKISGTEETIQISLKSYIENYKSIERLKKKGYFILYSQKMGLGGSSSGGDPVQLLLSYFNMIFHFDLIEYQGLAQNIRNSMNSLESLIHQTGFYEAALNLAMVRKTASLWTQPVFTDQNELIIEEGIHPLLKSAIPNTINAGRSVLLTGSNASGKSTFLRMLGVNVILAQSIHTVFAKSYQAPFFDIYSSIALQDNLFEKESYFLAEIHSIKRILDKSGPKPILCFIDEVLRGTNTVERIAASYAILKSFVDKNIFCIAATHDLELTRLLAPYYDNYHFEEKLTDGDVSFSYKIMEGSAKTRNAILLLEKAGFSEEIIKESTEMASLLDAKA